MQSQSFSIAKNNYFTGATMKLEFTKSETFEFDCWHDIELLCWIEPDNRFEITFLEFQHPIIFLVARFNNYTIINNDKCMALKIITSLVLI